MNNTEKNLKRIFLLPGEYCVVSEPTRIATLLGSCVAVCLWDRWKKVAGMNHFLLPTGPQGNSSNTRYGDVAIDVLIKSMAQLGSKPQTLRAQIFGGGAVVEHLTSVGSDIGKKNIKLAHSRLREHRIRIAHQDIGGGDHGRKIYFDSTTGEVTVKMIVMSSDTQYRSTKTKELSKRQIRVLTVDDSPTVLAIYKKIIELDPQFKLVGQAHDAYEARDLIVSHDPDVITLDIIMPKINGLDFLRKLMKYRPKPVVVISTIAKVGSKTRNSALRTGACDVIDKESLNIYGGFEKAKNILLPRLKAAATDTVISARYKKCLINR
ncbi:MAG: response regulator [Planctomycetes bacterium]|nr:response regulator [Planctomycetota bacterium]